MNYKDIEEFLSNLKSVMSCRIIDDNKGSIQEIHILADSSRNVKQICRDVQSVLISRYQIDVDYKKISIAQVNDSFAFNGDYRLKINSLHLENRQNSVSVKVVLQFDESTFEATETGLKTERNLMRLSSRATLKAVEKALGFDDCLLLEDIESKVFANKEMINCAVNFMYGGKEIVLCGNSFVEHSKSEAAVKATLCAINRRVAKHSSVN